MKINYSIPFLFLFLLKTATGLCTQHTITSITVGYYDYAFSPTTVSANVGDTIVFSLASIHFPVEVSQATWDANGNTSNGGFSLPYGGGTTVVTQAKTYYYVCGVHYAMGMKGTIVVTGITGINPLTNLTPDLEIFPNPVNAGVTIKANLPVGKQNQIKIFDMTGKCLYKKENISPVQYIDLSAFSNGVYFVAIKYDDVYFEKKLIVSR